MKKNLIDKRYNRVLNILLGIYVTLCLVFALLFNGFFIKPKAYGSIGGSLSTYFTASANFDGASETASYSITFNSAQPTGIFLKLSDEEIEEAYSGSLNGRSITSCYIFLTNPYNSYPTITRESISGGIGISGVYYSGYDSIFTNYVNNKMGIDYIGANVFIGFSGLNNGKSYNGSWSYSGSTPLEYVDSIEDAKKYLIDKDETVVKTGDPDAEETEEDDSLPVPQKLGTDIQNDDVGTPPFISGTWENPSSLLASYDAKNIQAEIQYKPTFQLYKKVFALKLAKVTSSGWLDVATVDLSNSPNNRWILYNAKTGYPKPFDSVTLHSGSLTQDVENVGNLAGYEGKFNAIGATIANGTNWRIRYRVRNKTSLWVVFHVNSIGSLKNNESVSFENASGDSVPASDVNYTNSAQTETVDKLNVNNFFDSLSAAINGIFNTANSSFTAQDTEGSQGFYAMFKATFDKFPIFWTFFTIGLIVAILLRILGR